MRYALFSFLLIFSNEKSSPDMNQKPRQCKGKVRRILLLGSSGAAVTILLPGQSSRVLLV
jgi:hypothetical protein